MTAEINNKQVSFSCGLYFLGEAQDKTGKGIDDLIKALVENPHKYLTDLLFLSAKVAAYLDDKPLNITKRELVEWVEDTQDYSNDNGVGAWFMNKLVDTLTKHVPKVEQEEGEVKKN